MNLKRAMFAACYLLGLTLLFAGSMTHEELAEFCWVTSYVALDIFNLFTPLEVTVPEPPNNLSSGVALGLLLGSMSVIVFWGGLVAAFIAGWTVTGGKPRSFLNPPRRR